MTRRSQLAALALLYLAGGVLFAMVTPIGEGPDEPAHLAYVRHLIEEKALPEAPSRYDAENYEWHQSPLDYLVSAALMRVLEPGGIDLSFLPNPSFNFQRGGSRAFAMVAGDTLDEVRALRIIRLGWGLIALLTCLNVVSRIMPDWRALWLAAPYLLAPQFLFMFAVVNNDAAVIAFSSLALLFLVRFAERPNARLGSTVGLCVLLALFAKASALFLVVPVIVAAVLTYSRGMEHRLQPVLSLLGSTAAGVTIWFGFNYARFGSVIPSVPAAGRSASPMQLVAEPRWIGSLFVSFWAKFGWLNTRMPDPFYLWFALLSLSVILGAIVLMRREETRQRAMILLAALIANVLLMIAFLVQVDLQPQGRYLFPSMAAIATFGVAGLDAALRRQNAKLAAVIPIIAIVVAVAGVATVMHAYA